MKRTVNVIYEDDCTEVQWSDQEPQTPVLQGYVQIDKAGNLIVPFRNPDDEAFVFVLGKERQSVYCTEDAVFDPVAPKVWDSEEALRLDVELLRDTAYREMSFARLAGPSDDVEQAWLDYVTEIVSLTDCYLRKVT